MKEAILHKEVWVPSLSPFRFKEQVDPKTGERKFILKGLMLPFNTVSRNAVLYNVDSIKEKHKNLIGRPVMYNHKVDTDMLPKGHFTNSYLEDDGWYYEADIDPNEKDLIRKLERQDLRHVSIQLIGGKVQERLNEQNQTYTEAWVEDVIEGSIVPAPGFLDTTAKFSEALHPEQKKKENIVMEGTATDTETGKKVPFKTEVVCNPNDPDHCSLQTEDMTLATAKGAVAPTQPLNKKKEAAENPLVDKVKQFLQSLNETPKDDVVHKWAEDNGLVVPEVEAAIYSIAFNTVKGKKEANQIVGDDPQEKETNLVLEQIRPEDLKHGQDPDNNFDPNELEMGINVEKEHTDNSEISKAIAKAHLFEIPDYYTRLKAMEDSAIKKEIDEMDGDELKEAANMLKEFSLIVGEYTRIPFGISGVAQNYQGQIGKVVKVGDDSYTIEFNDGVKTKIDKEVFDIGVVS